ncbi:hypothetical protein AOQ84DRAFT_281859 [Glonium stellatum]|uniref:Translation machinery-associated protein 16 n=1 Tax=Glonium stellatum TaxID=574774 RepID=A0A8E2FBE0_9PEZI|nr:hypothetical protein AOQ84DRAFT_281859 [Glonium stellatum]
MPSKSFNKVQKHIAKKKGRNTVLHENSRDTHRLQRASARDDKLNRLAAVRGKQNRPYLQRVLFFQKVAAEKASPFSIAEIQAFIEEYLHRDDEEIAQLKAERRPGRPPSSREDLLKQKHILEDREYVSGYWLPDLESPDSLGVLKEWNGEWVGLNRLKFVRIEKSGTKHESSFPPKGQS